MQTKLIVFFLLPLLFPYAQGADKIIETAEDKIKGETSHAVIEMVIKTPEYSRELKMESWWEGNEKALIKTLAPKKEAGNKTLKIGNEMWNYLSNTETTIKIPPSMMLQSWNGSDFTNDDLVRESSYSEDYNSKLIGEKTINDINTFKIELLPKPEAPVVWGKLIYWVTEADTLPYRIEYYDESGELIRHMEFLNVTQFGDRKIPAVWKMVSHTEEGHSTKFELLEAEFDVKLNDNLFSFRELERGG